MCFNWCIFTLKYVMLLLSVSPITSLVSIIYLLSVLRLLPPSLFHSSALRHRKQFTNPSHHHQLFPSPALWQAILINTMTILIQQAQPYHISLNMMECVNMEHKSRAPDWVHCSILLNPFKKQSIPSWIHEKSPFIDIFKKKPVSTDFKCGSQGKQCAWPEKLKSVMHQLNSILPHEKRIKSSGLAELCATDRGTDIQSITLHENQLEAKSHHRLPQRGRSTSQWYDKWFMDS